MLVCQTRSQERELDRDFQETPPLRNEIDYGFRVLRWYGALYGRDVSNLSGCSKLQSANQNRISVSQMLSILRSWNLNVHIFRGDFAGLVTNSEPVIVLTRQGQNALVRVVSAQLVEVQLGMMYERSCLMERRQFEALCTGEWLAVVRVELI